MIRTETEYQASRKRAEEQARLLKQQENKLAAEGLKAAQNQAGRWTQCARLPPRYRMKSRLTSG